MNEFCGSDLWDPETWQKSDPDFTECFQLTLLVWVPCAFLFLFTPLEFYFISKSRFRHIPWSFLNVTKLLCTLALIGLSCADIVIAVSRMDKHPEEIFDVHWVTPIIRIVTFLMTMIFVLIHRMRGIRSSGLLFLFWGLLMLAAVPQYRTEIRYIEGRSEILLSDVNISWSDYKAFNYMAYFPLVFIMFLLNCFSDKEQVKLVKAPNPTPELGASFIRRVTFQFYDKFMWKGFRQPVEEKHVWDLMDDDVTPNIIPEFDQYWDENVEKRKRQAEAARKRGKATEKDKEDEKKGRTNGSIFTPMVKCFGAPLLISALYKLVVDLMQFASPQLLGLLITFTAMPDQPLWNGLVYALALFVIAVLTAFLNGQNMFVSYRVGFRIRSALISTVYRKALRMSSAAKKDSTVGEIVNLMAVDAQNFFEMMPFLHFLWSGPLIIALGLYFLYELLGVAVFAGLGVMLLIIPINLWISTRLYALQAKQMSKKDERVKIMNEILNGMKVLKLYAWEPSFDKNVRSIRSTEISILKRMAMFNASMFFFWSFAPFMVTLTSFVTYVLIDENNVLDAQTAFMSLSLINILMTPMLMFPMAIAMIAQAWVSVRRIDNFMNNPELKNYNVTHDKRAEAISIQNGTFRWDDENATLKGINMEVTKGSLTAVVGPVGCGKSSLISSILGEMDKTTGSVNTDGTIAYVAQQAWIQNLTVQDNILFGRPMNRSYYDKVIEACALKPDLEMLAGGDQTEIGENGINLSGGQKQRIALARAVYANADIYLLDDPLSAVDAHVGKHIFDNIIGPSGLLSEKTRILVTHAVSFLPQIDMIYVLSNSTISERGNYRGLLHQKGDFSEFLLQHISDIEDESELKELKEVLTKSDENGILQRAISVRSNSSNGSKKNGKRPRTISEQSKREEDEKKALNPGTTLIEKEEAKVGSVSIQVYLKYFKSIGWVVFITTLFLRVANEAFTVLANVWLTRWTSDPENSEIHVRNRYMGIYSGLGGGQAVTLLVASIMFALGTLTAAKRLHNNLLSKVLRLPMAFFDTTPLGRILNRFSKDVDTVDMILSDTVQMWIILFLNMVSSIVVISVSTPIFTAVLVPLGILYYIIQHFYLKTSRQLKRVESVTRSPIYSHFSESITGQNTIRAYRKQKEFSSVNSKKIDLNQKTLYSTIIANRWLEFRLEVIGSFIVLFAALFAVLGRETLDPAIVGLSITYSLAVTAVLSFLVRMTADVETNIVAIERMEEYGLVKKEADWNKGPIDPQWPTEGKMSFDNLQIRYREGLDLVLKGLTFKVAAGEKVGIVGRTGAGKSSLTLALFRIVEAAGGRILIDGKDIAEMGLHNLRARLTIIPQDPVLFSGTLRMNIDPFEHFTDDDIWRVLEHSHLKSFVKSLPTGLLHEISEGGDNLSVGQRQLVCLARALLRKTKVLVLDEATAAVDLETDDLIQKTIRTEFADCTILTIAHRLNTIIDSDKVVVLDKGEIAEIDTPDALLRDTSSIFHSMAKNAGLLNGANENNAINLDDNTTVVSEL